MKVTMLRALYFHTFFALEIFDVTGLNLFFLKPVPALLDKRDRNSLFVDKPLD